MGVQMGVQMEVQKGSRRGPKGGPLGGPDWGSMFCTDLSHIWPEVMLPVWPIYFNLIWAENVYRYFFVNIFF